MIALQFAEVRPAVGQDQASVSEEVKRLGIGKNDNFQTVISLSTTPELSARLLVEQLHTVKDARLLNSDGKPETEHVLWSIRALRYITGGLDFCGKTSHHFGTSELEKNRKYWLFFKNKSCVPFFAMWPSRGSEYIAPLDAQEEIISQWREWAAREGKTFHYVPLLEPKPEDWLW
jgi:hypothetical protein